jgi:hypothetical protein
MGRRMGRVTYFVGVLVHASFAKHYDSVKSFYQFINVNYDSDWILLVCMLLQKTEAIILKFSKF